PHLDGIDLLPHLMNQTSAPPHDTLYWRYGAHHAIRHGDWKLSVPAGEPAALYDLTADIAESKDVSASHPDVVADLTRRYARWEAELQPPRWRDLTMKDAPGPAAKPKTPPGG